MTVTPKATAAPTIPAARAFGVRRRPRSVPVTATMISA